MSIKNHSYNELGSVAEPCKRCGISFSVAHSYDVPCSGRYNHLNEQALLDVSAILRFGDDFRRPMMARMVAGEFGALRPEVLALAQTAL